MKFFTSFAADVFTISALVSSFINPDTPRVQVFALVAIALQVGALRTRERDAKDEG